MSPGATVWLKGVFLDNTGAQRYSEILQARESKQFGGAKLIK